MASYDELKLELPKISEIVTKFPEEIRASVFDLMVEKFLEGDMKSQRLDDSTSIPKVTSSASAKGTRKKIEKSKSKGKGKPAKESIKFNTTLNLRGDEKTQDFRSFFDEKKPKSNFDFNVVALFYLNDVMKMSPVTLGDIYTCYDDVNRRPPEHFRQSLTDTKNHKGWSDFDEAKNPTLTERGRIYVKHDLPGDPNTNSVK